MHKLVNLTRIYVKKQKAVFSEYIALFQYLKISVTE